MSSDSRKERERLKEEFKEHYRKMREAKKRLKRATRTKSITDALKDMDTTQLMDSFDEFLIAVKSKIANVEARLDVAMETLNEDLEIEVDLDEENRRAKAKETLKQAKIEMGMLYNQIEQQADAMNVDKTIGSLQKEIEDSEQNE